MIPPIAADSRDKRTAVSMFRTAGGSDLLAKSYLMGCILRVQSYHQEGVKYVRYVEWAVIGGEWLPNSFRPWHAENYLPMPDRWDAGEERLYSP